MGGFDDHVAIMGDWMPPSPSPRAFFSSLMCDDVGSRLVAEPTNENKREPLSLEVQQQIASVNADQEDGAQIGIVGNQTSKCSALSEQNMSSRGGLLERMAARAGFNAPRLNTESIRSPDLTMNQQVRSPYLTIPPGLSPTTLLDSPVFLSNSLVQPSPTTGKFPFGRSPTLIMDAPDKIKDDFFKNISASSFTFKPVKESMPSLFMGAASKSTPSGLPQQAIPSIEVSVHSENSHLPQSVEPSELPSQIGTLVHQQADFSRSSAEKDNGGSYISSEPRGFHAGNSVEQSPPLDEQKDENADQSDRADLNVGGAPAEDGYNWRKYGQKQVKGSDYPRSYYKCTHPNCPVKKKVERSHEGHITEIIYKGAHVHPKPPPNRRSTLGSLSTLSEMQPYSAEQAGIGGDGDPPWTTMQKPIVAGALNWRNHNFEATSSTQLGSEYGNGPTSLQTQGGTQFESGDAVDASSTFSNDEDDDDHGTGSVSLGYDGEGDESESKRRKLETYATEMSGATRAIREPRVVVQTTSEVDILDDGYRWRKYGQKVVKGNPNPRSYYKCTSTGCNVRKHVERASHDLKSVITTYEGKHNHDVPAARNNSHVNSGVSNTSIQSNSVQSHIHRPEPSHIHNSMARFERSPSLASYGLPGRLQVGPTHGFGFGMSQQGLANFTMDGSEPSQGKSPVLPIHPCLSQPHPVDDMHFMLPKGEPETERAYADTGLNIFSGSSVYRQIMSTLPLGPQI